MQGKVIWLTRADTFLQAGILSFVFCGVKQWQRQTTAQKSFERLRFVNDLEGYMSTENINSQSKLG